MKMDRVLVWLGSLTMAVATVLYFLFITFETVADANKDAGHIDSRFDRLEQKVDKILEQTK
jgi:hypothetical protein